jgi:UDP-2,3-diacylglucosamine hydrolase
MSNSERNAIYFASDFHLGVPDYQTSLNREKKIVNWLNSIENNALEVFLVGDIFDFWFEYKKVVPKGFIRLQGKIAELTDRGIPVHIFTGNHDMWMFDYLPLELGVQIHREPIIREFFGKKVLIGHGDGLGPGDKGYKFLKKVFKNRFCQWCFARLHPNLGIGIANFSSKKSRSATGHQDDIFKGKENEWLAIYCEELLTQEYYDFFIFGHRHLPLEIELSKGSKYFNLGEWINYQTYLEFRMDKVSLLRWDS